MAGGPTEIVILGPPGSGKGTQARLLASRFGLRHISVGGLLRAEIAAGSPLGTRIAAVVESGELVDDADVAAVLAPALRTATRWILDGAPRTVAQAAALAPVLEGDGDGRALVLALDVPEGDLLRRLAHRAKVEDRADDTAAVIDHRLRVWADEGPPLIDWYAVRGMLVRVDGTGQQDEVADRLAAAVESWAAERPSPLA